MTNGLMTRSNGAQQITRVVIENDLSALSSEELLTYYISTCDALGLTWHTKPFALLRLNGKLVLYATRDCTDQLRMLHHVSITSLDRERIDDLYMVIATARLPDGRTDSSIGAVPTGGLKGEALANAYMKAETKAKRRVTLSICGLGMTDESETGSIPGAEIVDVDLPPLPPEAYAQADDASCPPRDVRVQAYRELTVKAGAWNADAAHEPIEHSLYQEAWTDDELNAHGSALKTALKAARAMDARAAVI